MNNVFVVCVLISVASAAVIPKDEAKAQIVSYENTNDGTGNYRFSYETSNGIIHEETGRLVNEGQKDEHIAVEGSYSYTDVDGKPVLIRYTADENGYQIIDLQPMVIQGLPETVVATLLG